MNKAIRHWLLALSLLCVIPSWATRYAAEYFWNTDPGVGHATKIAGQEANGGKMQVSVDASSLAPGMHILGMRVFNGKWSPTTTSYVYVPTAEAAAVTSGLCEYWWDSDPGIDSGNQLKFATDGSGAVSLAISSDGLAPGLHTLGMRTRIAGMWSPTTTSYVYVPTAEAATVTSGLCEYWWDSDPGIDNGSQLKFATDGSGAVSLAISSEGLAPGLHTLGMRTRIAGMWSPTTTSMVYVPDQKITNITSGVCEYWWNTDPGIGAGSQLTFETNGEGRVPISIPVADVAPGIYTLGMRTYVCGMWSQTVSNIVYVRDTTVSHVDYIEYFWGEDPGFGQGKRVAVADGAETVVLSDLALELPGDTVGDYILTVRPHSTAGLWGPSYTEVFSLASSVSVALDEHDMKIDGLGDLVQLTAAVESDNPAWPRPVTWTSSDPSVATVDSTGMVKAMSKGECTVRAECLGSGAYDECVVKVTASRIILIDGTTYDFTEDRTEMKVTYRRTFEHTEWQPLYVPFDMSYDEWADYADVAELAGVHMYDDGRTVIEFLTVDSGDLVPNLPYVIKPKAVGEVEIKCVDKTVVAAPAEEGYVMCSSPRWTYTLYGNYVAKTDLAEQGAYVLNDADKLVHAQEGTTLEPCRFYLKRTQSQHGYWPKAPAMERPDDEIYIMVDGEIAEPNHSIIGDANADGVVSVSDIVIVVSHILEEEPEGIDLKAADANCDGSITVTDIVAIVDMILMAE